MLIARFGAFGSTAGVTRFGRWRLFFDFARCLFDIIAGHCFHYATGEVTGAPSMLRHAAVSTPGSPSLDGEAMVTCVVLASITPDSLILMRKIIGFTIGF